MPALVVDPLEPGTDGRFDNPIDATVEPEADESIDPADETSVLLRAHATPPISTMARTAKAARLLIESPALEATLANGQPSQTSARALETVDTDGSPRAAR
ncbi:MAG: hypothetical protein ACR2P2_16455 [Nakamurella sp.]